MGEVADDMIEGRACSICGCYFIDTDDEDTLFEHGHPAVCWDCWSDLNKEEKKIHQRAMAPTI